MSRLERAQLGAERRGAAPDLSGQTGELSGTPLDALTRLTYLTVPEAADYVRRRSVKAFREWADRQRVPKCHSGRLVLYRRKDLDDAILPSHLRASHRRAS